MEADREKTINRRFNSGQPRPLWSGAGAGSGKGSPYDYRIKSVVYNPVDVVRIDSVAGVATHIVVAPDESYVTHAFGDSNSYGLPMLKTTCLSKPKGEVPSDTNLVLVTNKRTYNIVLHYVGDYTTKDAGVTLKPTLSRRRGV